ncbi:hypothetical protein [Snodgrassella communis]|uniref:hypothetical protein n=1 Tax=Snodgrassella communis TaxID=2946699 RepID=UPI0011846E08|nr:hypothetical protein [Snodgrassella communis]
MIISVLNAITVRHLRWGFPNCFNRFRKLGYQWIYKCVYRVYCELKLNLWVMGKIRIPPRTPERLSVPNNFSGSRGGIHCFRLVLRLSFNSP